MELGKKKTNPLSKKEMPWIYEKNSWGFSMSHGFSILMFQGTSSSKPPNNPDPTAVFATRFSNASEASSSTSSWISATPATPLALPPWWQKPRESRWTSTAWGYIGNPRTKFGGGKSWQQMAMSFHFTRHFLIFYGGFEVGCLFFDYFWGVALSSW